MLLQKALAELIGTFTLVFTGCGCMMVAERFPESMSPGIAPVVFGLAVASMIYAVGHISGAHFNPAVTLGFTVARHFPPKQLIVYWMAQVLGGILAIGLLSVLLPPGHIFGATLPQVFPAQAIIFEGILTFFFMFVIMAVATDTRAVGAMAGAAIGATIIFASFMGGPVTGASMNPARSIAPAIAQHSLDVVWIYILGPMIGAVLAALTYEKIRCVRSNEQGGVQGCC